MVTYHGWDGDVEASLVWIEEVCGSFYATLILSNGVVIVDAPRMNLPGGWELL